MKNRKAFILILLGVFTVVVLVMSPFWGTEHVPFGSVLKAGGEDARANIFWKFRVPRVVASFCAGAALAISGMAFQAMFRNPLATPFTLGVSAGAAFGATLYIQVGVLFSVLGIPGKTLSAFAWAMISVMIVYGLTRTRRGFTTATMLVAGVAVNFFFSSFIMFIQYLSDFTSSFRVVRWLMGGFEIVGFDPVIRFIPFVAIGSATIFMLTNELNLLTIGDDLALSRGVRIIRVKAIIFIVTSLMVGSAVSIFGPIGFIGMMAPHICRLFIGPNHRHLAPATFLFGGAFLVLCDTFARTIISPAEIPVGVITAILGGPFFLWLLMRGSSEKSVIS